MLRVNSEKLKLLFVHCEFLTSSFDGVSTYRCYWIGKLRGALPGFDLHDGCSTTWDERISQQ